MDITNSYINSLLNEIESVSDNLPGCSVDTVYFGGGTPSILEPVQIERIINLLSEKFDICCGSEITIEMNPDDLKKEKLDGFIHAGITRIVLGVQTLDITHLSRIGRKGRPVSDADLDLFFSRRKFTRCLDIIAGLPDQTWPELLNDLEKMCAYRPEHISLYLLSVDDNTPLGRRFKTDDIFENNQANLWCSAMAYLKEKGYIQYEISNYCISGYESRHNSKYWDFSQYIGFGPGAHSFVGNRRYSNNMSIPDYLNSGRFVYDEISVSINNKIAEFIMTSLRRIKGFTDKEFITATGLSIPGEILSGICSMEQEGLMHVYNGRYCLSEKGLFIADRIIFRLVENYL